MGLFWKSREHAIISFAIKTIEFVFVLVLASIRFMSVRIYWIQVVDKYIILRQAKWDSFSICQSHWSSANAQETRFNRTEYYIAWLATNLSPSLSHIDVVDITLLFLFCAASSAAVVVTVATSCMIHLMFLFYSFLLQLNSYIIPILHITFRLCVQHQPEFIEWIMKNRSCASS